MSFIRVVFQLGLDALHVHVGLLVLGLQVGNVGLLALEETEEALGFLGGVKALQLPDQVGDELAGLPHVLGLDLGQGGVGEITEFLLAGGAVLQHHLGIGDVDLFGKIVHHLLFFGGQGGILHLDGSFLLGFLHHLGVGFGVQGQAGRRRGGIQSQAGRSGNVQVQFRRGIFCHNSIHPFGSFRGRPVVCFWVIGPDSGLSECLPAPRCRC